MVKEMAQAATIYLQEFAVLEEARDELFREVDALWTTIWEEAKPQLDELAKNNDRVVHLWPKKEKPGQYTLRPNDPSDGTTKGQKASKSLTVEVHDPRQSETPGSYDVRLVMAMDTQRIIRRELPTAHKQDGGHGPS